MASLLIPVASVISFGTSVQKGTAEGTSRLALEIVRAHEPQCVFWPEPMKHQDSGGAAREPSDDVEAATLLEGANCGLLRAVEECQRKQSGRDGGGHQ